MNRRELILGLTGLFVAPVIVRASSLMAIKPIPLQLVASVRQSVPNGWRTIVESWYDPIQDYYIHRKYDETDPSNKKYVEETYPTLERHWQLASLEMNKHMSGLGATTYIPKTTAATTS